MALTDSCHGLRQTQPDPTAQDPGQSGHGAGKSKGTGTTSLAKGHIAKQAMAQPSKSGQAKQSKKRPNSWHEGWQRKMAKGHLIHRVLVISHGRT
eukprot:4672798-Prorocentrum_lima.AAC.1